MKFVINSRYETHPLHMRVLLHDRIVYMQKKETYFSEQDTCTSSVCVFFTLIVGNHVERNGYRVQWICCLLGPSLVLNGHTMGPTQYAIMALTIIVLTRKNNPFRIHCATWTRTQYVAHAPGTREGEKKHQQPQKKRTEYHTATPTPHEITLNPWGLLIYYLYVPWPDGLLFVSTPSVACCRKVLERRDMLGKKRSLDKRNYS